MGRTAQAVAPFEGISYHASLLSPFAWPVEVFEVEPAGTPEQAQVLRTTRTRVATEPRPNEKDAVADIGPILEYRGPAPLDEFPVRLVRRVPLDEFLGPRHGRITELVGRIQGARLVAHVAWTPELARQVEERFRRHVAAVNRVARIPALSVSRVRTWQAAKDCRASLRKPTPYGSAMTISTIGLQSDDTPTARAAANLALMSVAHNMSERVFHAAVLDFAAGFIAPPDDVTALRASRRLSAAVADLVGVRAAGVAPSFIREHLRYVTDVDQSARTRNAVYGELYMRQAVDVLDLDRLAGAMALNAIESAFGHWWTLFLPLSIMAWDMVYLAGCSPSNPLIQAWESLVDVAELGVGLLGPTSSSSYRVFALGGSN